MIGGPRQVGKTTLAKNFVTTPNQYLSWDDLQDRRLITKHQIDPSLGTVVLDEIHKDARWRTLLKGLYDKYHKNLRIIVTGSARLDHFRKGGDSPFFLPAARLSTKNPGTMTMLDFSSRL